MKNIFKVMSVIALGAALAGCGHKGTDLSPRAQEQNAQSDRLNAMSAEITGMQTILKNNQLDDLKTAMASAVVNDAQLAQQIQLLITAAQSAPTTASITALVAAQITAAAAGTPSAVVDRG